MTEQKQKPSKTLLDIDKTLYRISRNVYFMAVNPKNAGSERKKFLSNKNYNPQFRYSKYGANIPSLIKRIEKIKSQR